MARGFLILSGKVRGHPDGERKILSKGFLATNWPPKQPKEGYLSWEHGGAVEGLRLSNARLAKVGVDKETKRRALLDLEKAGLITVDRRPGRAPRVTLTVL